MTLKSPTQAVGDAAEKRARKFLKQQGLKFITSNYRSRYGEIDLIMSQQETLVFIEVRLRTNRYYGSGAESVTLAKQRRIIQTAQQYLQQECPSPWAACRFDVVSIGASMDWIQDAFTLD